MDSNVKPTTELTAEEHQELRELRNRVNGPPETRTDPAMRLRWGGIDDTICVVRVRVDGLLVSSVFVAERTIVIDGQRTHAGGIRGMLTHPEHRRQGFGRIAMQHATDFIWQELRSELGLLLSSEMAVPFYISLGWQVFTGPLLCEQPGGTINYTEVVPHTTPAMALMPDDRKLSINAIDMCGLPW